MKHWNHVTLAWIGIHNIELKCKYREFMKRWKLITTVNFLWTLNYLVCMLPSALLFHLLGVPFKIEFFFTSTMDQGNLIFNNKRCWPQFLMARYLIPHDKLIYFSCSRKYTTSTYWLPLLLNGQFQIKGRWKEMRFFAEMIQRPKAM